MFSPRPQGGVIALEVCLAGHREVLPREEPVQALYGCLVAPGGCVGQLALGLLGGRSCGTP